MSTISTNGWDSVYTTTYKVMNSQIAAEWPTLTAAPSTLAQMNAALTQHPKVKTSLTMGPWEVTQGGSGKLIQMKLPITDGTFNGMFDTYPLAGSDIVIQLSLQWVPEPGQTQFAIDTNLTNIETDLNGQAKVTANITQAFKTGGVTLSDASTIAVITKGVCWKITDPSSTKSYYLYLTAVHGSNSLIEVYQYVTNSLISNATSAISPVTVISAGNITDDEDGPLFLELVSKNIDENLSKFEFVFASVDVVTQLAKDDVWAWLQPTTLGYAVVEPSENPTNVNCGFAILSMVNNNVNTSEVLQADLGAVVSGCDSTLLISPQMFVQNMLFPGASSVFTGSTSNDFKIDEKNLSITNVNKLTWANCKLDDGTPVTLTVDPGDFSMAVENGRVAVAFANLNYPITMLELDVGSVEINFNGQFDLALKQGSNGNQTLWFDLPADQSGITDVSAVMNKTYYTVEEAIGIVTIALSVIAVGGSAAKSIATKAATEALEDGGMLEAEATQAEIQAAFKSFLEDGPMKIEFMEDASEDALEMINSITTTIKQANCFASIARWSAFLAALTGVASGSMVLTSAVLEKSAVSQWEDTPSFKNFADLSISRYTFAGLTDLNVQSASLADSLQIGFKLPS